MKKELLYSNAIEKELVQTERGDGGFQSTGK